MPISISCPNCDHNLNVNDKLAGKTIACPACKISIILPEADTSPSSDDDLSPPLLEDDLSSPFELEDVPLVSAPDTGKPTDLRDIARECLAKSPGPAGKVTAIKLYKERTGASLSEAKDMIDSVERDGLNPLGNPFDDPVAARSPSVALKKATPKGQ